MLLAVSASREVNGGKPILYTETLWTAFVCLLGTRLPLPLSVLFPSFGHTMQVHYQVNIWSDCRFKMASAAISIKHSLWIKTKNLNMSLCPCVVLQFLALHLKLSSSHSASKNWQTYKCCSAPTLTFSLTLCITHCVGKEMCNSNMRSNHHFTDVKEKKKHTGLFLDPPLFFLACLKNTHYYSQISPLTLCTVRYTNWRTEAAH